MKCILPEKVIGDIELKTQSEFIRLRELGFKGGDAWLAAIAVQNILQNYDFSQVVFVEEEEVYNQDEK